MRTLSSQVTPEMDGKEVTLAGWVHEKRDLGGLKFIVLRDKGGFIQVTCVKTKASPEIVETVSKLGAETVIKVTGMVKKSPQAPRGLEVLPSKIDVVNVSALPLPLDPTGKTPADLDTRLDNRLFDIRRPEIQAIFEVRSVMLESVREYMRSQGFTEVSFPSVVKAGAEGGSLLFPVAYFEQEAFLSQSAQLYKQYLACTNLERVFTIGQSWRAEPSHTVRHLNEFWQLDYEMAFVEDEDDVMKVTEGVFEHTLRTVVEKCKKQLDLLKANPIVPKLPFPRVPYTECLKLLSKEGVEIKNGEDIPDYAEKKLSEIMLKAGHAAFFITKWPKKVRGFYIMMDGDISRGFDLDYMGLEMCSGGQREHRVDVLEKRLRECGYDPANFSFYLSMFRYGAPPHGGIGLGMERLLCKMLNLDNVREAIPFPRDTKRLIP